MPEVPDVSRDDLDTAIEAGDWAAVGATAALLAAASDSQSYSSRSRRSATSQSQTGTSVSSLDAARAAELDHLVDAGDWEGVVLAAAKFEASEDTSTGASLTIGSSHGLGSATGSQTTGTGSQSTTASESQGKGANRDEVREEVEALVRRVVPEEIDNVDEMMLQFKGREEELVETLRTMQERQVAQRARVQGQKQAKRDARITAQQGGIDLPVPGDSGQDINESTAAGIGIGVAAAAGVAAGVAAASGDDEEDAGRGLDTAAVPALSEEGGSPLATDTESEHSDKKRKRTALELAIEAGDWEAVGEAAAMMSDASVTSGSFTDSMLEGSSLEGGSSGRRPYKVDAEKAAQLDEMIDQGDWTGVVAAASRFSAAEGSSSGGSGSLGRTATTSEADRDARLKEEQEALQQAEIWMDIARQSQQEGTPGE